MKRIGVDTGGTFTDFVQLGPEGWEIHKVLSTPADPSQAVLTAVEAANSDLRTVELFAHGTTVTTNAAIQRRGVKAGLLTTQGFRDVLQIRRTTRGELYNFQWEPPIELVPRELRMEVHERTAATGKVLMPPNLEQALDAAERLLGQGIESLAICFVNAYANGSNERNVRQAILRRHPDLPVYISSEILPEWREFERTSTTVVSAYIGPVLSRYLSRLERELSDRGYANDLLVMASNGGLSTTQAALDRPAYSIGSGPAAGVVAQLALAADGSDDSTPRYLNVIGMDIGGTSTDISIIGEGLPTQKQELELEFGTTVSYPVIDIGSVGAGGGTIAWIDAGGLLHLGPYSAGADPGPACLGRGGTEPTVTDANVVLGRQNPHFLAGGAVPLDPEAGHRVISSIGKKLGLGVTEMARGILTLAASNIVSAIRQRTVERGLDPREFVLMAYGGGGPLHGVDIAAELGLQAVIVPPHPGVTSAVGLLLTDVRHDLVSTFLQIDEIAGDERIRSGFEALEKVAVERLRAEGFHGDDLVVQYSADLRYLGQTHELNLRIPRPYTREVHGELRNLFSAEHTKEFGHAPDLAAPIEIVNLRVAGIGRLERPRLPPVTKRASLSERSRRTVFFDQWMDTPVYERADMGRGLRFDGPAVVEQLDATTLIPPGWTALVDHIGSLHLRPIVT